MPLIVAQHLLIIKLMETENQLQERALFKKLSTNDNAALQRIMHRYRKGLLLCITAIVKEQQAAVEILSDIYLLIWQQRMELAVMKHPKAWVFACAKNRALNYYREKRRTFCNPLEFQDVADPHNIEDDMEYKELDNALRTAVAAMPASALHVYKLRNIEGLNRKEIAKRLNLSESTIKNQLTSAHRFIRNFFDEYKRS